MSLDSLYLFCSQREGSNSDDVQSEISNSPYDSYLSVHSEDNVSCDNEITTVSLLEAHLQLVRRFPMDDLIRAGDKNPKICGMSYNSARDELFLADNANRTIREMSLRDNSCKLRDLYRAPQDKSPDIWSVSHLSDSDTVLVCFRERALDKSPTNWLVAFGRNCSGSEWHEAQRVQTDGVGWMCCSLCDSRVLIGGLSSFLELFRVESCNHIARVQCIHFHERYSWFSATRASDTLVAMSFYDQSVRIHRLREHQLMELTRFHINSPDKLQWIDYRLLVASGPQSDTIFELDMSGTQCERWIMSDRLKEVIARIFVINSWCAVDDGLAVFDGNSGRLMHYQFK